MSGLARQQQALLAALWANGPDAALDLARGELDAPDAARTARGLRAYRSNGRELAVRALAAAYPATAQLLGAENFEPLARLNWLRYPAERGDVAHWGAALQRHLGELGDLLEDQPWLPDVARVEWALHCAGFAADGTLDAASLQWLAERDPEEFTLHLAQGTQCIASDWPVASIVLAQLSGGEPPSPGAETALVWRRGLQPEVRPAVAGEADFIAALQDRRSLADSLRAAPALDFNAWLAPAVQGGLVLGALPL